MVCCSDQILLRLSGYRIRKIAKMIHGGGAQRKHEIGKVHFWKNSSVVFLRSSTEAAVPFLLSFKGFS